MPAFTLMVCPHDTVKNPDRWYRFVQYLTKALREEVHFEMALDFEDFHASMCNADLVYANPSDTLTLINRCQFEPLVRPSNAFDELVLVASAECTAPSLATLNGDKVATVPSLLSRIAVQVLERQGVYPSILEAKSSWLAVISAVVQGEAPFGIVYRDTFNGLSESSQAMVNAFATTDEQVAFHSLSAGPKLEARKAELAALMLGMATSPDGTEILQELGISGWSVVAPSEIEVLQQLNTVAI